MGYIASVKYRLQMCHDMTLGLVDFREPPLIRFNDTVQMVVQCVLGTGLRRLACNRILIVTVRSSFASLVWERYEMIV